MPDTLDGRFAVLATVIALALVRLEGEGEAGNALSVALTERFIEVMESEHRELGHRRSDAGQDRAQARRLALAADRSVAFGRERRDGLGRRRHATASTDEPQSRPMPSRIRRGRAEAALDESRQRRSRRSRTGKARMNDRFAHHLRLDQIRDGERLDLVADEAERQRSRRAAGLNALDRLEAHVTLSRDRPVVRAEGRLAATLEQSCVVTGEPVAAHVDEPFALLFLPAPDSAAPDDEVELGEEDCDVVFYEGGAVDLGSAIADTLALSVDPYPRSASADTALKEAGILTRGAGEPVRRACGAQEGRAKLLEGNVVVEVGVERRRLRARLGARGSAAAEIVAARILVERAARRYRRLRGCRAKLGRRGSAAGPPRRSSASARWHRHIRDIASPLRCRPWTPCAGNAARRRRACRHR